MISKYLILFFVITVPFTTLVLLGSNCGKWKPISSNSNAPMEVIKVNNINVTSSEVVDVATADGIIWALTKNSLFNSTDGGNTWDTSLENFVKPNNFFTRVVFADQNHGFIICESEQDLEFQIFITSNSGKEWKKVQTFKNININDIHLDQSGYGLIVGGEINSNYFHENWFVLETHDFGKTWKSISLKSIIGLEEDKSIHPFGFGSISRIDFDPVQGIVLLTRSGMLLSQRNSQWVSESSNKNKGGKAFQSKITLNTNSQNPVIIKTFNSREGFGTLFTSNLNDFNYEIPGINMLDAVTLDDGAGVLSVGSIYVRNEIEKLIGVEGAIWHSTDLKNWEMVSRVNCPVLNCGVKKLVKFKKGVYFAISENNTGELLMIKL